MWTVLECGSWADLSAKILGRFWIRFKFGLARVLVGIGELLSCVQLCDYVIFVYLFLGD